MKIVQVGASIGNDHVTRLVKEASDLELLVLVEPNPKNLERLSACYKDTSVAHIENVAILPNYENGNMATLYFAERDASWGYEVTSVFKSHLEKHSYSSEEIESFTVEAFTLNDLLEKHNITDLDYLFIDVEGIDKEILLSLDLKKFNIKTICIEVLHINNVDELYQYMKNNGYVETGRANHNNDVIFTKKSS